MKVVPALGTSKLGVKEEMERTWEKPRKEWLAQKLNGCHACCADMRTQVQIASSYKAGHSGMHLQAPPPPTPAL